LINTSYSINTQYLASYSLWIPYKFYRHSQAHGEKISIGEAASLNFYKNDSW